MKMKAAVRNSAAFLYSLIFVCTTLLIMAVNRYRCPESEMNAWVCLQKNCISSSLKTETADNEFLIAALNRMSAETTNFNHKT